MSEAKGRYTFAKYEETGEYKVTDGSGQLVWFGPLAQCIPICRHLNAAHAAGVEEGINKAIHDLWEAVHDQPEPIRTRYVELGNQLKTTK